MDWYYNTSPSVRHFQHWKPHLEVPKNLRDIVVSVAPEKFLNEKGHIGTANGIADTGEWLVFSHLIS